MRRAVLFIVVLAALSSREAIGRDSDGQGGCRKSQVYWAWGHRAGLNYGPPPFIPTGSIVALVTGCWGFDHGPFYSPHSCILPYPCEYYGTCKR
jgi:hypothetical protein